MEREGLGGGRVGNRLVRLEAGDRMRGEDTNLDSLRSHVVRCARERAREGIDQLTLRYRGKTSRQSSRFLPLIVTFRGSTRTDTPKSHNLNPPSLVTSTLLGLISR